MNVYIRAYIPWILILRLKGISAQDCNNFNSLPDLHDRDPVIPYSPTNPAICDKSLTEGWYKASVYDMPTSPVPINRCGTVYGFYMDIHVPTDSSEHNARACLSDGVDHCFYYVNIKVKNCGLYRLYHLQSTGVCNSAYCFHLTDQSLVPSYRVPMPTVSFNRLDWIDKGSDRVPQLVFNCEFQPSTTENDLFYVVKWSANNNDIGSDKIVTSSTLSNGYLYEEEITNAGFRHGIWIFCSVRTQYSPSSTSTGRTMSRGFFAGFEVKHKTGNDMLYISERESATLRLSPTVPFGCENQNPNCKLLIHIEDPNKDECEGNTFITESSRCQIEIIGKTEEDQETYYTNGEYKKDYSMKLSHGQSEDSYDKKSHYTVALKTNTVKHEFWSNTSLRSIPVNIRYKNSIWRGDRSQRKFCAATGDPHFKTFDGNMYSYYGEGAYLLYENKNSSKTVQIKTFYCDAWRIAASCTCAVAVRAGRDIFIIDICNSSTIIDFPVCDDGVLDVRTDGDKIWKVTFPTGTIVRIEMVLSLEHYLNVYIDPTAADENNTRGLCGYLDGRKDELFDYIKSDGSFTSNSNVFAKSWLLDEDFFYEKNNSRKFDDLLSWSNMIQLCICPTSTKNGKAQGEQFRNVSKIHCSYKSYVGKCQTDRFKYFECFVKTPESKRRRRDAIHRHCSSTSIRNKRSTSSNFVSRTEAQELCETTFNASASYKGCSENGVSSVFMFACINDYMILGEQTAIKDALNSFLETCVSIIEKDVELKSKDPTLVGELLNNSCLNNCSDQGQCEKGYCKCNADYAGSDCSLNIKNPPIISSLEVFCDTLNGSCDTISIYGRNFLNTNSFKCEVSRIHILQDGSLVNVGLSIEDGIQRSPFEAICALPKPAPSISNVFVNAYNISVSNDGNAFSDKSKVFVYDSLCQELIDSNGTTSINLRNGYCFIDGSCIPDGLWNPRDICQQCMVTNDTYDWIQVDDCTKSSATTLAITDQPSSSSESSTTSTTSANQVHPSSVSSAATETAKYPLRSSPKSTTANTATVNPLEPSSTTSSSDTESSNTNVIVVVAVCVVVGVIIGLIVTIALVKHYNNKHNEYRLRNTLGSQISIQVSRGTGDGKTAAGNDTLAVEGKDKHPGNRSFDDATNLDFSRMIDKK